MKRLLTLGLLLLSINAMCQDYKELRGNYYYPDTLKVNKIYVTHASGYAANINGSLGDNDFASKKIVDSLHALIPTLQQVLTAGSTLTQNTQINTSGYDFVIGPSKSINLYTYNNGTNSSAFYQGDAFYYFENNLAASNTANSLFQATAKARAAYNVELRGGATIIGHSGSVASNEAVNYALFDSMRLVLKYDTVIIKSLPYTLSRIRKKVMIRDTVTGLTENIDPSLLASTLQEVLTAGSELTDNNTVSGDYNLYFDTDTLKANKIRSFEYSTDKDSMLIKDGYIETRPLTGLGYKIRGVGGTELWLENKYWTTTFKIGEEIYSNTDFWVNKSGGVIGSDRWAFTSSLTPAQITSNQDDYNPTDFFKNGIVRLSSDASRNITGLEATFNDRAVKTLLNVGSNNIVLINQSSSSYADNRFAFDRDITLLPGQSITLYYDPTVMGKWRPLDYTGSSSSGISDGDKGDITVGSSGTTLTIDNSAVTYAKMQNASNQNVILGRWSSGSGVIQELTLGSSFDLTALPGDGILNVDVAAIQKLSAALNYWKF